MLKKISHLCLHLILERYLKAIHKYVCDLMPSCNKTIYKVNDDWFGYPHYSSHILNLSITKFQLDLSFNHLQDPTTMFHEIDVAQLQQVPSSDVGVVTPNLCSPIHLGRHVLYLYSKSMASLFNT